MTNPVSPAPVPQAPVAPERRTAGWIGKSVTIKGDVVSAEDLTIDGRVDGTIELGDNSLTIGVGASVRADLKAHTVLISGTVTGNVTATDRIEIRESGSVEGDISTPRLMVREGAVLRGKIDTIGHAQTKKSFPVAV